MTNGSGQSGPEPHCEPFVQKSTGQRLRTGAVHSSGSPPRRIVKIRECLSSCLPPVNDYRVSALLAQVGRAKYLARRFDR